MSFRQFCEANQKLVTTGKTCATMRAMNDFESKHKSIAKAYFDLSYADYHSDNTV